MDLKAFYHKNKKIIQPVLKIKNRVFGLKLKNKGSNNRVAGIEKCRMKNTVISIFGDNNTVVFNDMSSVFGVHISIYGSDNTITLGERNYLEGCAFCIEDDNNRISTGNHVYIYANTEISAIESTEISIGDDCLFSANIMIRTGDSHAIYEVESGKRVNRSESIRLAKKVWIGNGCKVLKGAQVGEECVIGTGSLVTHKTPVTANAVLAGVPAKVVSRGIRWSQQR